MTNPAVVPRRGTLTSKLRLRERSDRSLGYWTHPVCASKRYTRHRIWTDFIVPTIFLLILHILLILCHAARFTLNASRSCPAVVPRRGTLKSNPRLRERSDRSLGYWTHPVCASERYTRHRIWTDFIVPTIFLLIRVMRDACCVTWLLRGHVISECAAHQPRRGWLTWSVDCGYISTHIRLSLSLFYVFFD